MKLHTFNMRWNEDDQRIIELIQEITDEDKSTIVRIGIKMYAKSLGLDVEDRSEQE